MNYESISPKSKVISTLRLISALRPVALRTTPVRVVEYLSFFFLLVGGGGGDRGRLTL